MKSSEAPRIHLGPEASGNWLEEAVVAGGGQLVAPEDCEAIVWGDARKVTELNEVLGRAGNARWVQLPFAGIENFVENLDHDHIWTCGKGVYAEPVAELALALGIAGLRSLNTYARADNWTRPAGVNLLKGRVTILGGGGITESLVRLLQPWKCHITVVRNRVRAMDGVDDVLEAERFADGLPGADLVVLALPLTAHTEGMFSHEEFGLMEEHAWIVNVARGKHIVTDDLVEALRSGAIGGAGLDVTDPEPLPDEHPLWSLPNCIITPHVGNTPDMAIPLLSARVTENVRRFGAGDNLIGLVDVDAGY
ncbi:MAG: D-isomer specific 2-hydroxyacid dehydrogenase family protein [Ilumatobacteraceae bacterium]|nr:D-isomer specific 2-hydroxyacid dehydrogenase family protein [Ilumatobacteraceae bacterium]